MAGAERGPFRLRLLHPVLAEIALARGDQRLDRLGRLGLGDGDQGDLVRPRPASAAAFAIRCRTAARDDSAMPVL